MLQLVLLVSLHLRSTDVSKELIKGFAEMVTVGNTVAQQNSDTDPVTEKADADVIYSAFREVCPAICWVLLFVFILTVPSSSACTRPCSTS